MINHYLDNLVNILFLYLILNQIDELESNFHQIKRPLFDLARIIAISLLVILMLDSVQYKGYFFDQRMLPLFIFSFLRGYRIAIPVLFIVTAYRLGLGGEGMLPEIFFGIVTPTVLGLMAHLGGLDFFYPKHFYPLLLLNWILSFGAVILFPDGVHILNQIGFSHFIIYGLAGVGLHKLLSDQLHRRLSDIALRETEDQLEKIINIIPDALLIVRRNGRILFASPSSLSIFPTSDQERLLDTSVVDWLTKESRPLFLQRLEEINAGMAPELAELLLQKSDKQTIWVEMNGSKIHYKGIEAILLVFRDISERKKTEEELRNLDKLSTVGQLAASVAHEIRNPLTSLKGFLQLMNQSGEVNQYIPIMLTELERINLVTTEMLLLSKPQMVNFQKHNLITLLTEVIALIRTEGNLKGIAIRFEPSIPEQVIYCDVNQLKQLFINLIKNAIDAMPNGGEINLSVHKKHKDQVEVLVQDEGMGIPPEILANLGRPFNTTKEKGTGLGLTVCYQIIQSHHGEISFHSEPGKGTKVSVLLPIEEDKVDEP